MNDDSADIRIEALISACALGILHDDLELSELVLKELQKSEREELWCHHIAFLTAELYLKRVNLLFNHCKIELNSSSR